MRVPQWFKSSTPPHLNMALLANPQHEAFAQARFDGKILAEAH